MLGCDAVQHVAGACRQRHLLAEVTMMLGCDAVQHVAGACRQRHLLAEVTMMLGCDAVQHVVGACRQRHLSPRFLQAHCPQSGICSLLYDYSY